MLLFIDNYDSFSFNLARYFTECGATPYIIKNDALSIDDIIALNPKAIVISPGPFSPEKTTICVNVIKHFYQKIPILGVCLGHQCLAYALGASIISSKIIMHGKITKLYHNRENIFYSLPFSFKVGRYHSLTVSSNTLPNNLQITAWSDNEIMAINHRELPLYGLQFHPESIMTEYGHQLIQHFLEVCNECPGFA